MMKLKAIIYRYTGVFLANQEQLEYLESEEFWAQFVKLCKSKTRGSFRDTQGLLIGLWQADRGFARPYSWFNRFRKPRWFWSAINWIATLGIVVKWDVQWVWRKLGGK